jgi:hypothetical protein
MSFTTDVRPDQLEEALDAFHSALDAYPDHRIAHGREPGWVDDHDEAIVEALLNAGWTLPATRCGATSTAFS